MQLRDGAGTKVVWSACDLAEMFGKRLAPRRYHLRVAWQPLRIALGVYTLECKVAYQGLNGVTHKVGSSPLPVTIRASSLLDRRGLVRVPVAWSRPEE